MVSQNETIFRKLFDSEDDVEHVEHVEDVEHDESCDDVDEERCGARRTKNADGPRELEEDEHEVDVCWMLAVDRFIWKRGVVGVRIRIRMPIVDALVD